MEKIEIQINGLIAQSPNEKIVCGNNEQYAIVFNFSDEWNEHTAKTARFIWNDQYQDVVFTGNECLAPQITNATVCMVGVFAGNLKTTTPALIGCIKSILCGSGTPAEPTPDVYAQIMQELEKTYGLVGDISTALDRIIEIQNSLIGGDVE